MPGEAVAAKERGNEAFKQGDYAGAVDHYTDAIDYNPNEAAFFSNRSAAFAKMGKFSKALDDGQECVRLRPDWHKAHFRLGDAYFGLKLFARSLESYSRALEIQPHDQDVAGAVKRAEAAMHAKLMEDDDDDLPEPLASAGMGMHNQGGSPSYSQSSTPTRGRALPQGPGVFSMEDYLKYRAAGGAQVTKDDDSATFVASTANPMYKPSSAKDEVLRNLGVKESLSNSSTPVPDSPRSMSYGAASPYASANSAPSPAPSGGSSLLQQKRAELMASLGMPVSGASASPSSTSASSPAPALSGDWAKIRGTNSTSTPTPEDDDTRRVRRPEGGRPSSREEFISSMGLDMRQGASGFAMPPASYQPEPSRDDPSDRYRDRGSPSDSSFKGTDRVGSRASSSYEPQSVSSRGSTPQSRSGGTGHEAMPLPPSFDYKSAGALDGMGSSIKAQMMESFRSKANTPAAVSPSPTAQRLREVENFKYRQYKESSKDDFLTRQSKLDAAILADALGSV